MVTLPMTFSDPDPYIYPTTSYSIHPILCIFHRLSCLRNKWRQTLKFGLQVDHSKTKPVGDK